MKKLIPLFVLFSLLAGIFYVNQVKKTPPDSRDILPAQDESDHKEFSYRETNLTIASFSFEEGQNLILISNLEEKLTTTEIVDKYGCKYLINAGFYTPEYNHIGLFVSEGRRISSRKDNSLFNGILAISASDEILITDSEDVDAFNAVQTGPLLTKEGEAVRLQIRNDEAARRMVALVDDRGRLHFMVFYDPQSVFNGPFLSDLPNLLKNQEKEMGIYIRDAINLDGGSASAFISPDLELKELSTIGGFFCLK